MPRALTLPQRQLLWKRAAQGHSPDQIALALGIDASTVRKLLARFRDRDGELAPDYDACGQQQTSADPELLAEALDLRRQHAYWGAGLIRVLLAERYPRRSIPCERTLQRCFADAGLAPAPQGRRARTHYQRATQPHQVWQLDAAERLRLADGSAACWLRLVDECSGAFLQTQVFPPRRLEPRTAPANPGGTAHGLPNLGSAGGLAG